MRGFSLVGLLLVGCATVSPERQAAWQREQSALKLGCTWGQVEVAGGGGEGPWQATCDGRSYLCRPRMLYAGSLYARAEAECEETEASKAAVYRQVVLDRLSLETGCAPELVAVTKEADWSRGGEKAYRMTACGKAYVCTTAAGRTDCKAALGE